MGYGVCCLRKQTPQNVAEHDSDQSAVRADFGSDCGLRDRIFYLSACSRRKGKARVDVLQQISDSNSVNRTNMVKAMDALYEDFYDDLTAPKSEKSSCAIQMLLEQTDRQFKRIGMDMTIDILMNDRRMFSTDPDENNLKSLKNTYWYIKHYSGETDTSWNLRFWDVDDISTYGLAYGKTVYAQDGKVVGMIVLTSRYEALFRTFQKLVSDGVKVYILDRNGIIISHTNPNRVATGHSI